MPSLSYLKREKARIEQEGYLQDCWISKYRPGGSACGGNTYYRLQSRKALANGKRIQHLKTEEIAPFKRLIQNGRKLKQIERAIAKQEKERIATRAVLTSSVTDEWYTPPLYVNLARSVMGGIDLDPASCTVAQSWIQAATCYTIEDNGLAQPWFGRVWLNPPYGSGVSLWTQKVMDTYETEQISQAILLVRPAVGSSWYQALAHRYIRCEPHKRIRFIDIEGNEQKSPVHGNVFFYLGEYQEKFREVFKAIGVVCRPF